MISSGSPGQTQMGAMQGGAYSSANPLQPAYYGGASAGQAATLGSGYQQMLSPYQSQMDLYQSYQPAATQQDQQLMSMLAAQGISPGSTAAQGAYGQLANQQAAGLGNALAGVQQGAQQNLLGLGEFNAGAQNQQGQFNANLAQNAGLFNAGAYNSAGQQSAADQMQAWLAQFGAYNNLNDAGVSNTAATTQQGLGNAGQLANTNATQYQIPTGAGAAGNQLGQSLGSYFAGLGNNSGVTTTPYQYGNGTVLA